MKKLLVTLMTAVMVCSLAGCGKKQDKPAKESTPQPKQESTASPEPTAEPEGEGGPEAGTTFDSVADFNTEEGQNGPWQYYFSGDNGETFDACGSYNEYPDSGIRGWYPWEGSYIGVGFNNSMEGFLELNTDGVSKDWSNQMGVLAFEAPAAGKYVITAKVWNPWGQPCDVFTFKKQDGTVVLSVDMTEIVDNYAYVTPTDVQMEKGEKLYIYCNSTDSSWVSAYIGCTMVYEPVDDSVYTVPEVEEREVKGVEPDFTKEAVYNAYQEFDKENAEGANGVWLYASTTDGADFVPAVEYRDTDYDADEWFSEDGTGIGTVGYLEGEYLEMNTPGSGATMMALGFKAPADGTFTFSGYAFNPYSQSAEKFYAVLNGETVSEFEIAEFTSLPNEYSFDAAMSEGDVLYFYCPSATEGGWVSAYLSVFVNTAE
mgnify:CR=1 FL=1